MTSTPAPPLASITSPPSQHQLVQHEGRSYATVKEGLAYILVPAEAATQPQLKPRGPRGEMESGGKGGEGRERGKERKSQSQQQVFYNPIQQFNRDLSVLVIKAFGEERVEGKRRSWERKGRSDRGGRAGSGGFGSGMDHGNINGGEGKEIGGRKRKRKRGEEGDVCVKAETRRHVDGMENGAAEGSALEAVVDDEIENMLDAQLGEIGGKRLDGDELEISNQLRQPDETIAPNQMAPSDGDIIMPDAQADPKNEATRTQDGLNQVSNSTPKPFIPSFTILDALSATGLRALRYAHEIPFATSITANDLLPAATESIKLNVQHNKLSSKINAVTGNALSHMYSRIGPSHPKHPRHSNSKYDVIDLDPYGTAAPFLDAAVQSVRDDGGLLCVTCTDAGVWASNGYPEKSFSLYGGTSARGDHGHENGLRLILHAIASTAARYGLAIEPLLSLSIDFYARVFVRVYASPADVKFLAGKTMLVHNCDSGCGAWTTQMLARNKLAPNKSGNGHFWKHILAQSPEHGGRCEHCGMKTHIAGPVYAGPLHNPSFVKKILDGLPGVDKETYATKDRIEGMLTLAMEESLPAASSPSSSSTVTTKTTLSSLSTAHPSSSPQQAAPHDPSAIDPAPFFFVPSSLAKVVHCVTPHENAMRGALIGLGYTVTRSHTKAGSLKTNAPWNVVWEVMREWVRVKAPVKEGAVRVGTAGWVILGLGKENDRSGTEGNRSAREGRALVRDQPQDQDQGEPVGVGSGERIFEAEAESGPPAQKKRHIVFDEELGKQKDTRKLVRYQLNPRENWGPMARASGSGHGSASGNGSKDGVDDVDGP